MKTNLGIIGGVLLIAMVINGCSNDKTSQSAPNNTNPSAQAMKESNFDVILYPTLESLLSSSKIVAEVKVIAKDKSIMYQGVDFTTSTVVLNDIVIGDQSLKNKEIKILETGVDKNIVTNGERYLIFLDKYVGPVVQDAYVPLGVYQGKFHINSNEILEYEGKKFTTKKSFQDNFHNKSLSEVKQQIKDAKK